LDDFDAKIVHFMNKSIGYFKKTHQNKALFHFITTFALQQHTKFTMTPIFTIPPNLTLSEAIQALDDAQLNQIFGRTIVGRSYSYLEEIEAVNVYEGGAETTVWGSESYDVEVEYAKDMLLGKCSCPYGGLCKHLAAFVQHLRDSEDDIEEINVIETEEAEVVETTPSKQPQKGKIGFNFEEWLQLRTEAELRALVMQYAPPEFRKSLEMQHATPVVQQQQFQKSEKRIRELLLNAEDYTPSDFEDALMERLEVVRAFWQTTPEGIKDLLVLAIETIDKTQDGGFHYDDYNDGNFDGGKLVAYMANFIASISETKIAAFTQQILNALLTQEFGCCENFLIELLKTLKNPQLEALKTVVLKEEVFSQQPHYHQSEIWQTYKAILSTPEQIEFLTQNVKKPIFALDLSTLYEQASQFEKAIEVLLPCLQKEEGTHLTHLYGYRLENAKVFERRIELENKYNNGENLEKWSINYIKEFKNAESLQFALQYLPNQQDSLEVLLASLNISAFANYLELSHRTAEVVSLFKQRATDFPTTFQYDFYKRHKKTFPMEAEKFFTQVLNTELPHAKESHYYNVVEALLQLREVLTEPQFRFVVGNIRIGYKRRSNLMGKMDQAGV
jgi:hypothetical protein